MLITKPEQIRKYDLRLVYGYLRKISIASVAGTVVSGAIAAAGLFASIVSPAQTLPGIILVTEDLVPFFIGITFASVLGMRYVRLLSELSADVVAK